MMPVPISLRYCAPSRRFSRLLRLLLLLRHLLLLTSTATAAALCTNESSPIYPAERPPALQRESSLIPAGRGRWAFMHFFVRLKVHVLKIYNRKIY